MSDYSALKATINANIKTNNNHEITGSIMNSVLNAMVNSLGAGYQFMGVATPTNPGSAQTPDYKCFYLATTPGTYTNLGGLVVADGEVALLKYDTSWAKEVTGIATADHVSQLGQQVIYDVTANNADAKFASLSALLSDANLSTLIPAAVRCGGMSIRFVQTSDNKYVQYRLMANSFTTDEAQWQGAENTYNARITRAVDGKSVNFQTGAEETNHLTTMIEVNVLGGYDQSVRLLNYIDVSGTLYVLDHLAAFYDSNGDFISGSGFSGKGKPIGYIDIPIPSNASILKFNVDRQLYERGITGCHFLTNAQTSSFTSKWKGKKAVFLGDSITEGTIIKGVTRPYPTVLDDYLQFSSFINYGLGGSRIGVTAEGKGSFLARYPDMDNNADLVVVMGGTNDALYPAGETLGQLGDKSQGTFYGALYLLITGLMGKYPSATIVFMTPLHYYDKDGSPTAGEAVTDIGMDDWADAIVKSCHRYGLPCIDFRNICGLNPNIANIRTTYFADKWIHPNQAGINLLVSRIYKQFELF